MNENVSKILSELYQIDPGLREKEIELITIIDSMFALKPNVKIDSNFKNDLHFKIMQKINSEKLENYKKGNKITFGQIFAYLFGTVGLAAFGFAIFNQNIGFKNLENTPVKNLALVTEKKVDNIKFESKIKEVKGGFGSLSNIQDNGGVGLMANPSSISSDISLQTKGVPETRNFSKGSEGIISNDNIVSATTSQPVMGKMMTPMTPVPAPVDYIPEVYRYSFSGELNIDLKDIMPVYKKDNGKKDFSLLMEGFKNLNFNGVNIGKFENLGISNISLNEDKKYGYNINIDFENSNLSIYKNWNKWPQIDYTNKKEELLKEDEIISIAKDFLNKYNIDLSKYGAPKIEKQYLMALAKYESARVMPEYFSNMTNVVFPLVIDGNEISEEYGQSFGVRVEVDLNEKKVTSLNGLTVDNYLKSDYKIENNLKNILKVANVGGRYGFYDYQNEKVKYLDVKLKNPKLKYVNTYSYKNNVNEQFLIPAIVFEVEKNDSQNYLPETISVPLLKDFYKYDENGNITGNSQD